MGILSHLFSHSTTTPIFIYSFTNQENSLNSILLKKHTRLILKRVFYNHGFTKWDSNTITKRKKHKRFRSLSFKRIGIQTRTQAWSLVIFLTLFSFLSFHSIQFKYSIQCLCCRVLSNFAFSFSIISVLTGITTLYNSGLKFGGPVVLVYGWLIAGFFTMAVGLSMAEICSSYPTSGGLYYWSAKLAGTSWAPFASWITGWYKFVLVLTLFSFVLKSVFDSRK